MKILASLCTLMVIACGPGQREPSRLTVPVDVDESDLVHQYCNVAQQFAARGEHLWASFYFEAALAAGADEVEVLAQLLAVQLRSGRLRAARSTIDRLQEISPHCAELSELSFLLSRHGFASARANGPRNERVLLERVPRPGDVDPNTKSFNKPKVVQPKEACP